MRPVLGAALFVIGACAGSGSPSTTVAATTTTNAPTTTAAPVECPAAPYELEFLPTGVGTSALDADTIELDEWTSEGGTQTTFYGRSDGSVAIALVRGTLPTVQWPGERGEISVDGTRGVAGPHPDGTWVVGWYEEPGERCDEYSMIFYPPVAPADVEAVLLGMNRVGG
jgi:hypothetical protein